MGWFKRMTGLSEAQRQLSRKIGVPLSGQRSRRKWFWQKKTAASDAQFDGGTVLVGCLFVLIVPPLALLSCIGVVGFLIERSPQSSAVASSGAEPASNAPATAPAFGPTPPPATQRDKPVIAGPSAEDLARQAEERRRAEQLEAERREAEQAKQREAEEKAAAKTKLEEQDAATLLDLAKRNPNRIAKAKALQSLIKEHPQTKAAEEARQILKTLN